jgi:hypothetical protein
MSTLNEAKHQLSTVRYPNNGGNKNGDGNGNGNGRHSPAASQSDTLVKNLVALLADESPQIRLVGVKTLSETGDPSAIEPLKALLRRETSSEVPETAIQHAIYSIEISVVRARNRALQELLRLEQEELALRQRIAEFDSGYTKVTDEQPNADLKTGRFKEGPSRVVTHEQNGTGDTESEIRFANRQQRLEDLKVKIGELRRETPSSEVSEQTSSANSGPKKRYCSECQTRVRRFQFTCHYCGQRLLAGFLPPVVLVLCMLALMALLLIYPTR